MDIYIKEGCIGCGTCNYICDHVFKIGSDGRAYIDYDNYNYDETYLDVIEHCPAGVIIEKEQN